MSNRTEALSRTLDLLKELVGPSMSRDDVDAALSATRVRLEVRREDLRDPSGQAAIYVLCCLLARSGMRLEADLPDVPVTIELPGLASDSFANAMPAAVALMFPGAAIDNAGGDADVTAVFGDAPHAPARTVLRVGAVGRRATAGRDVAVARWHSADPLAAIAASGLAAAEIHKLALRRALGHTPESLAAEPATFEVPFELPTRVSLPPTEMVSAGAISQNTLLIIAAAPGVEASFRIFDRDVIALSNANRCPFVMLNGIDRAKVHEVVRLLPERLRAIAVPEHLTADTASVVERDSWIVVGADDIGARHLAQRLGPRWLGIGATSHFLALVSEHRPGMACAGCLHPHLGEDLAIIPTVSIVSFWAGYLLALRMLAGAIGVPYPASRQVTNFWPLHPRAILEHRLAVNPACPLAPVHAGKDARLQPLDLA